MTVDTNTLMVMYLKESMLWLIIW